MNATRAALACWAVFATAAGAAEAEDCALQKTVLRAQFTSKLPKGFKLVSTKKEKRSVKQVLTLPDGGEVTVTLGGCEHLAYSIGIKGKTITTKTVGSELVAVARQVLPTLPMDKDATVDPKGMLKALEDARISVMPAQLPCGDATCQLSLEPVPEKAPKAKAKPKGKKPEEKKDEPAAEQPATLLLSYDFPL